MFGLENFFWLVSGGWKYYFMVVCEAALLKQMHSLLLPTFIAAEMQSFNTNWTSAKARHQAMPTSSKHWTRAQMRHGSVLAVHAHPVPEESPKNDDEVAVNVFIRRKRLSDAWETMQSCDPELWTDVCNLYSMVAAMDQDPLAFDGVEYVFHEVAEAKALMQHAELLAAVETIEAYKQEEWKQEQSPACVRRGSLLVVHENQTEETPVEAQVRHIEHAEAWNKMKSCDKDEWIAACRYHEEKNKIETTKREKLEAAAWVMQDFNAKAWKNDVAAHRHMAKHAATLAVHITEDESNDPAYQTHRRRLVEAWETMKAADKNDWNCACKKHEDIMAAGLTGMTSNHKAVRNRVGTHAA